MEETPDFARTGPQSSASLDIPMSRRKFLTKTLETVVAIATTSVISCLPSRHAISPRTPREQLQDAFVNYECNPAITMPNTGCYTGTNLMAVGDFLKQPFIDSYGIPPAFNACSGGYISGQGTYAAFNDLFPRDMCDWLINMGIVPVIRYIVTPIKGGYRDVITGKHDDDFKRFAQQINEFGNPLVLLPWQCVNEPPRSKKIWVWSQADPGEYKAAWVRMHNILRAEGANSKVLWSTKMVNWGFTRQLRALDPISYTPDKAYVDIIGWNCNSNLPEGSLSFEGMFERDYLNARDMYPTKPQMLWEFGADTMGGQSGWIDEALEAIQTGVSS